MLQRLLFRWPGLLGGVLLSWTLAQAQTPAPAQPPAYDRVGVIHAVDQDEGSITVNDSLYEIAPTLQVHAAPPTTPASQAWRDDPQQKPLDRLRPGMRIGFTVTGEGSGKRGAMSNIWLLSAPPGSRAGANTAPRSPSTR